MKLSLSVRIAEAACKTKLNIPFEDLVQIAKETGYRAICMRASAGGVQTSLEELQRMHEIVDLAGLAVSMVTADFDVPLNNENGPNSLRNIRPSLDVASALRCNLIRICMKTDEDIDNVRRAADLAGERGIRLAHQCHTTSLFEQVGPSLDFLKKVDRPNFGLIYEPANLMLCGEEYGLPVLELFKPYIFNVYVQNHVVDVEGPVELETWCLGMQRFHHLPIWETGGVDFDTVFAGLRGIGYDGFFTIHQAEGIETVDDARNYAATCHRFVSLSGMVDAGSPGA